MKAAQINFVGSVIGQLSKVPQTQLTQEYVATLFADRLESRYKANFDRTKFLEAARVTPRMAEDAESRLQPSTIVSPKDVIDLSPGAPVVESPREAGIERATGPGGAWADVPGATETVDPIRTTSGHVRPFAPRFRSDRENGCWGSESR